MSANKNNRRTREGGDDEMLSRKELSGWLKVCMGAIDRYCRKEGLPFIKVGRRVLFRRGDVEKWLGGRSNGGAAVVA